MPKPKRSTAMYSGVPMTPAEAYRILKSDALAWRETGRDYESIVVTSEHTDAYLTLVEDGWKVDRSGGLLRIRRRVLPKPSELLTDRPITVTYNVTVNASCGDSIVEGIRQGLREHTDELITRLRCQPLR